MNLNQAMNQIDKGPNLSRVVMPLVKLMNGGQLSWSDRETVADAIREAIRIHESMKAEQNHLLGRLGAAMGQQLQAGK